MVTEITKAQLLALRLTRMLEAGTARPEQISLAKRNNAWMALECARKARDILGAAGITDRTRVIFGPPGHAYVYLSYGMHECLNIVAEPEGTPGCVLIRALEPVEGIELMRSRRPAARKDRDLASGPGKLTRALGITREHNGVDMTHGRFVVRTPTVRSDFQIGVTKRIGITKCADLPLRFQRVAPGEEHVYHLFQVRTDRRDDLLRHVRAAG